MQHCALANYLSLKACRPCREGDASGMKGSVLRPPRSIPPGGAESQPRTPHRGRAVSPDPCRGMGGSLLFASYPPLFFLLSLQPGTRSSFSPPFLGSHFSC